MATTRDFPLGVVLTVTTGKFLIDDIGDLCDVLNFMTGDNLMTHQLPRAAEAATPAILEQHPELAGVEVPELETEEYLPWVERQVLDLGGSFSLEPLADYEHKDPIAELIEMRGGNTDGIVVVAPGGDEDHGTFMVEL